MEPSSVNVFWEANFWGIVGTAAGVLGLIISYLNWQYSKPSIRVSELKLVLPSFTNLRGKSKKELEHYAFNYTLHISFQNKKGGPGSIEKPNLIIETTKDKIVLRPVTQHTETEQLTVSTWKNWTVRHGKSWNLDGGESGDDELAYYISNVDDAYKIINSSDQKYSIEYRDNFGRKHKIEISDVNLPFE